MPQPVTLPEPVTTRLILEIAYKSDTDPRTVRRALDALRAKGKGVRGRPGERIRAEFARRGLLGSRAA